MAEGEHGGVEREYKGATREQGRAVREYGGAEREHIDEMGVSGRAKRRHLSQSAVTCWPGFGEVIYVYICVCALYVWIDICLDRYICLLGTVTKMGWRP